MSALMHDPRVERLRVAPQAVEAEQAVLGGLLLAPKAYPKVAEMLTAESFYRHDHALIWEAIVDHAEARKPFDAVILADWFERRGKLADVDGGAYLIELASTTPSAANIVAYAELVADRALQRKIIEAGTDMVNGAFEGVAGPDLLAEAQQRLIAIQPVQRGGLRPGAESLGDWFDDLERRYQNKSGLTGLPTPWHKFNEATHGLQRGELALLAARPSMGKSVAGLNIALFNGLRGTHTALFSLEMTARQVHRRNIASLGKVPHDWLLAPSDENEEAWSRVTSALSQIRKAALSVDDTPALTIAQVMARARSLHMQKPIELLVVDHIHDFTIRADQARFEYGRIAQGLKTLAKEFDCPVVAVAQLNRGAASRTDKRPTMTDLRESGELEQKADLILFLHREDYYDKETHLKGVVELSIAKGRDIEAGKTIHLLNDYAHMALRDWEGPLPSPPPPPAETAKSKTQKRWAPVAGDDR